MKQKTLSFSFLLAAACIGAIGSATAADYTSYTNNSNLTLASGDTLTVSSGNVDISYGGSGAGLARTLNASLANSVTFNIGSLRVGTRSDPANTATSDRLGTLNLGADNTITASTIVSIGGGGHIVSGILTTPANSTTIINTPVMDLGTGMRTSSPSPNLTIGSGSSITIGGVNGGRTALAIGEERQASPGINWSSIGTMDLSAGQAALKLSSLVVGNAQLPASDEMGAAKGTLTMSANTSNEINIEGTGSVLRIALSGKSNTDIRNNVTGTVNIGHLGGNSSITSTNNGDAILIANNTGTASWPVTGTLSLNGGAVTITTTAAAITGGTGAGTESTLNLGGGVTLKAGAASGNWIRNLTTAAINSGGAVIDTNGFGIGVSQSFSGSGGLTKAGPGTLTLGGGNTYTGDTVVSDGELVLADNASLAFAITDTGSNKVTGGASAVFEGDFVINISAVTIVEGNWPLVDASTKSFSSTFTVTGWMESGDIWTLQDGEDTWKFSEATGVLYLNQEPPSGNDYDTWDKYYEADLSDRAGDFDGDGMSNFEEYAFGLNPISGASANPVVDMDQFQTLGLFTYTRRIGSGLTYTPWISSNLIQWEPAVVLNEIVGQPNGLVEPVTVEVDMANAGGKFFIRVTAD